MDESSPDQKEWEKILRQAWITTSLERDKAIVTLSSAGLALLVSFLKGAEPGSTLHRLVLLAGMIGFTASSITGVWCFHLNRRIIACELQKMPERSIPFHDHILIWGFILGALSIFCSGLIHAIQ